MNISEYRVSQAEDSRIFYLDSNQCGLLYYGAFHTFNPDDFQIKEIEKLWTSFRPTLAYSEGRLCPLIKNRTEAIEKYGEQGFLRFLADRDEVKYRCLDPTLDNQTRFLMQKRFHTYQIKVYFLLRRAIIEREIQGSKENSDSLLKIIKWFNKSRFFRGPIQNFADFEKYASSLFPELESWREVPSSYFYSKQKGKFLFQIHEILMEYRDQIMLNKLIKSLNQGNRIFALVGKSHVVAQETIILSRLLKKFRLQRH
ncbi:hypothetical protein KGY73_10925 [bacterium]|nr:hypothetical protein [bacterium]